MTEKKEKQIGKFFVLNKEIGRGAFAICKKGCEVQNDQKIVAVKIIDKNKLQNTIDKQKIQKELEHIKREIANLKACESEHIVQMFDIAQTSNNLYIFLEYCDGGSMDQYIAKQGNYLAERESLLIFEEICKAFKILQQNKIIHRDIKPQNILIHNSRIKIADFGFSKVVDDTNVATKQTLLGTPFYLPIEILTGEKYSSKCDVFSVGIVIYEMIYGKHPFYADKKISSISQLVNELRKNNITFKNDLINPHIKSLMKKMLQIHEKDRISWDDLFNDIYFSSQKENIQKQNKLMENVDSFSKSMMESDAYLNKHLVQGQIVKRLVDSDQQEYDITKETKQFHDYVLFERNIAVFFFNTVRKLWGWWNKNQKFNPEIVYKCLFCLAKMGLLFLVRLEDRLEKYSEKLRNITDEKTFEKYKQTQYYTQGKFQKFNKIYYQDIKLIKNDRVTQENLFNELFKKAQKLISNQDKFWSSIDQNQYFKVIFKEVIVDFVKLLQQSIEIISQDGLILMRYLQIGKNPYIQFQYKINDGIDFHKFYENLEKADRIKLIMDIKKCIQNNN